MIRQLLSANDGVWRTMRWISQSKRTLSNRFAGLSYTVQLGRSRRAIQSRRACLQSAGDQAVLPH